MAETTFIITPSGDEYSMVSDDFFSSLESNQCSQSTTPDIALDWLLNVKKFCVTERANGKCISGVYEATYGIEDYASYATPVTNLSSNYKELQIGGEDSSNSTGEAGEVMQTSPRNPHRYTLQEDPKNSQNAPSELTGEYLGAFFHHKGDWYASYDDVAEDAGGLVNSKEITESTKKVIGGSGGNVISKTIQVLDKFFPKETDPETEDCLCGCNLVWITPANSLLTLPINFSSSTGYAGPWKHFWTKTLGTYSPSLTNGFAEGVNFSVNGSFNSGQTVIRGIFAYVATDPINVSVSLQASSSYWEPSQQYPNVRKNITLLARLYNQVGGPSGLLQTFISSNSGSETLSFTLPATNCPKVLWLGAAIQPTGEDPQTSPEDDQYLNLPSTEAQITFSFS